MIKCPICKGTGKLEHPKHLNDMEEKHAAVLLLYDNKFSIRQIMRIVGYKSPNTIQEIIRSRENHKARANGR
jgi:transposase-like protein